ncbi:MAG: competence/damage-inducible protein A [Terriglobales bacterium]
MQAEIVAVGSELLGFDRVDTNSLFLTRELLRLGITVARKAALPDDKEAVSEAIGAALQRSAVVICTGGLGLTEDDRTVAAAARALGCPLVRDAAAARGLRQWFHDRHRRFTAVQLRQALRLAPAVLLPNRVGTAPGQWWEKNGRRLVLLPGPPLELQAMFAAQVRPRLARLVRGRAHAFRVLSIAGMGEEQVEAVAAPIYRGVRNPATTILATAAPQVELHFHAVAGARGAAQKKADALARRIERRLGTAVFSRDQHSLAEVVAALLVKRGESLAVAESCTGGLLGERITEVAGATAFFTGGVVSYADAVKQQVLGVPGATLGRWGAVSAPTARAMAEGVRARLHSDWGISITGIAGPAGGSMRRPVGTVYIAVAAPAAGARATRYQFFGDRDRIRRFSAQTALNMLRLALL